MQRVLMLLACVCGCSFAGLRLAERLKCRAAALRDLRDGLRALISAVAHTNRPLAQIAGDIARSGGTAFWRRFSELLSAGEDAGSAWRSALREASARGGPLFWLAQRDKQLLESFSSALQKTDRKSLAESCGITLEALSALIEGADAVYAQKGRVYRVLGLFMGLGIGILLW